MDMLSAIAKATDISREHPTILETTFGLETTKLAGLISGRPLFEATG